jgi:hypothetical protein
MSPLTILVGALILGLAVAAFVFGSPAVAVPIVLAGIVIIGLADWRRRREQAGSLKEFRDEAQADKVEFTARDKQTLAS